MSSYLKCISYREHIFGSCRSDSLFLIGMLRPFTFNVIEHVEWQIMVWLSLGEKICHNPLSHFFLKTNETMWLVLGLEPGQNPGWDLNPQSFNWDHTWSQGLMNLRFLMSHHRKNSVRDKVIGKKWIYLERKTHHRQFVGCVRRWERASKLAG